LLRRAKRLLSGLAFGPFCAQPNPAKPLFPIAASKILA
jgi:hypothetical protein